MAGSSVCISRGAVQLVVLVETHSLQNCLQSVSRASLVPRQFESCGRKGGREEGGEGGKVIEGQMHIYHVVCEVTNSQLRRSRRRSGSRPRW